MAEKETDFGGTSGGQLPQPEVYEGYEGYEDAEDVVEEEPINRDPEGTNSHMKVYH